MNSFESIRSLKLLFIQSYAFIFFNTSTEKFIIWKNNISIPIPSNKIKRFLFYGKPFNGKLKFLRVNV